MSAFAIKVRTGKVWSFLASAGRTSRLRVHALRFKERAAADTHATALGRDNPGVQCKVVEL